MGIKTVGTPYTTMGNLLKVCERYGVQYLLEGVGFSPYYLYAFDEFELLYTDETSFYLHKVILNGKDRSQAKYNMPTDFLFYNFKPDGLAPDEPLKDKLFDEWLIGSK